MTDRPERRILLVRHATPGVDPARRADEWRLSPVARAEVDRLAERIATYRPTTIVTSPEPKATGTAALLGERLGLRAELVDGLREHDRTGVPFLTEAAWERALVALFTRPDALVFGRETATEARARFGLAVDAALADHAEGDLVVVTHGTVLALFVAQHNGVDPLAFWRRLAMPDLAVLAVPGFALLDGPVGGPIDAPFGAPNPGAVRGAER